MLADITGWALTASPAHFWTIIAALIAVSTGGFFTGFRHFRRARIIEDMPTSRIRSAAQGYVELEGRGQLLEGPPIVSPLSGITCTWYRYKVEERRGYHSSRGLRSRWDTIASETSDALFLLVDATGQCVIDPDGASVTTSHRKVWYGNTYPTSASAGNRISFGNRYRFSEQRLHPGEGLYAIGMFASVGGANEAFNAREEVRELLSEWKRNRAQLLQRFDANQDGEIDAQEWESARTAAVQAVRKQQVQRADRPPVHLMSRTGDARRPFLLSNIPQFDLVRRGKTLAASGLTVFLGSGAAAVWLMALRLGV
jgi:hypothetical protein